MKWKTAAWITDFTFLTCVAILVAMLLVTMCGCAGTKLANRSNSHELSEQDKAIKAGNMPEVARRNARMTRLQVERNKAEGVADRPGSDDLLPLAIEALRSQSSLMGILTTGAGMLLGGGVTDWWKEILAAVVAAGLGGYATYERKRRKTAENGNGGDKKKKG